MVSNEMLRIAASQDIDEIIEIEKSLFYNPWDKKQFLYEMNENLFAKIYVLLIDDKIVGYIDFWITFDIAQLARIGIKKEYQNRGYGKALMSLMKDVCMDENCENISLEVRVKNEKAINFYKKMSFDIVNIRKGYYQDGEDAYLMICPIIGGNI